MPARLFPHVIAPKRIRTFLILFALALTFPLVALGIFAVNYMAALEEREIENRVLQVARALAENIDRELESAIVTLQTLATSRALRSATRCPRHPIPKQRSGSWLQSSRRYPTCSWGEFPGNLS
jgi:hypothetical protein